MLHPVLYVITGVLGIWMMLLELRIKRLRADIDAIRVQMARERIRRIGEELPGAAGDEYPHHVSLTAVERHPEG